MTKTNTVVAHDSITTPKKRAGPRHLKARNADSGRMARRATMLSRAICRKVQKRYFAAHSNTTTRCPDDCTKTGATRQPQGPTLVHSPDGFRFNSLQFRA